MAEEEEKEWVDRLKKKHGEALAEFTTKNMAKNYFANEPAAVKNKIKEQFQAKIDEYNDKIAELTAARDEWAAQLAELEAL
jgi:hypothetical protein